MTTVAAAERESADADNKISFVRQIKPILSDRCFLCHGLDQDSEYAQEAGLRLDLADEAEPMIEAGSPDDSELYLRIISDDEGEGGSIEEEFRVK